jgi:thiosulfate/3-mercaptopyruvate sulfurtransferase
MLEVQLSRRGLLGASAALTATLLLAACGEEGTATTGGTNVVAADLLVESDWLADHLQDNNLRIVDVRAPAKYQETHIPGAINLTTGALDHMVNEFVRDARPAGEVAEIVGAAGIGDDHHVVIYDDNRSVIAARLFWVLDYYGHSRLSILNGGYPKWTAENRAVTRQAPRFEAATFSATPDPTKVADKDYILANMGEDSVALCDARTPGEYTGEDVRRGAGRGGRVPGAVNIDWVNSVTGDETPTFKALADLKQLYEAAGITPDKEVITYCQSAVRGAHSYYVLKLLGYPRVRNYDGSWQDWSNNQSLPIEQG